MRATAMWKVVTMAFCLSCATALAEESAQGAAADVTLRDGTTVSCEQLAVGHNYSLCFQSDPRYLTLNHADVARVDYHSPHTDEMKIVRLR